MDLSSLNITKLKEIAKELKVPRYSAYKRDMADELRAEIERYRAMPVEPVVVPEIPPRGIDAMGLGQLKKEAKRLNIRRYTTYSQRTIEELRDIVRRAMGGEIVQLPIDHSSIKDRIGKLIEELDQLPLGERLELIKPLERYIDQIVSRPVEEIARSPIRSPIRNRSPSPVRFEVSPIQVLPSPSVIPEFIQAEEIDPDDLGKAIQDMMDTSTETFDDKLREIASNIEKCLLLN